MIKIITANSLWTLEERANEWIKENKVEVLNTSISKIHLHYNTPENYALVITYK